MNSRSIISVHIGQCGVQLGSSVWELLCAEHDLNPQGRFVKEQDDSLALKSFFSISKSNRHVPRAVFLDLDPSTVDEIKVGSFRNLFHPDQLIGGTEDASSNFSRGYYTVGRNLLDKFMHVLRHQVEISDSVQGFIIADSPSGGTGGGLGALLHECISLLYPKTAKLNVCMLPAARLSSSTVDPYNTSLSTHFTMEHTDVSLLMDNEAMYNVCYHNLLMNRCSYVHINRIVAQLWSAITAAFRYEGIINSDLGGLLTNLVPFPRLQFPVCSYAPISNTDVGDHQPSDIVSLTRDVFKPESRFLNFEPQTGKYMSCILMYRGDVTGCDVAEAIRRVKCTDMDYVDWCPTGFKVTINHMPPTILPQSLMTPTKRNLTMIANTSAVSDVWEAIATKTRLLYAKRSFVHWFVSEGMEEGEINDSIDDICSLIEDYRDCVRPTDEGSVEKGAADTGGSNSACIKQNIKISTQQSFSKQYFSVAKQIKSKSFNCQPTLTK